MSAASSAEVPPDDAGRRLVLHRATGHLLARLQGTGMDASGVLHWVENTLQPMVSEFISTGGAIKQAIFDLSQNRIGDAGVAHLLDGWLRIEGERMAQLQEQHLAPATLGALGKAPSLVFFLQHNGLSDVCLGSLARFTETYGGEIREVHLSGNALTNEEQVLHWLQTMNAMHQYPLWIKRQRRYAPMLLRMEHCGLSNPGAILEAASASSIRACLMNDPQCSRTACKHAGVDRGSCPLVHLKGFMEQAAPRSQPSSEGQIGNVAVTVEDEAAEVEGTPAKVARTEQVVSRWQDGQPLYLCGACNRERRLDQFGRHQFRKPAKLDDRSEVRPEDLHLVRRCNDCVTQPCGACKLELPLSDFARSQMMRPHGSRRCRICAEDTFWCVRCKQPKTKDGFSQNEIDKHKDKPRVCLGCETTNPYYERRYGILLTLAFRSQSSGVDIEGAALPALPVEAVRVIVDFSEPGDEFVAVLPQHFECFLCKKRWNLLGNEVERHVRSDRHKRLLLRLAAGELLKIPEAGPDAERLRAGLGLTGKICTARELQQARALVRVEETGGLGVLPEALLAAGLTRTAGGVTPRLLDAARALQEGGLPSERRSAMPSLSAEDLAEVRSARRRWKLFGHMGVLGDAEDEE
eukprot:CAMPEP_0178374880 /NCGR_PEP_ID=MMETSP0689_2-20121128/2601_1 /TAXON_ID=160604 /ORGANISM="Amphidinium massartii, Strain CS-259" /LENGTH=634 /DNA_ID=CAMNT_0019994857 /DNA_START=22 /DNA_END=1922 /DNA_ORIENTATION=-